MIGRSIAAVLMMLLTSALAAQSPDAPFIAWAKHRAVPIDAGGRAFRSLDRELANVRLIGVGESVHEAEPFLGFRLQLLQDLVRHHRVTALAMETGLPEAMALNDYVLGKTATVDFDATLPFGFGSLLTIRRSMEWLREWNLGDGRRHPVSVYGVDFSARSGSMVPALDRLQELTAGAADVQAAIESLRPTATRLKSGWWKGAAQKYDPLAPEEKTALTSGVSLLAERVRSLHEGDRDRLEWARRIAQLIVRNEEMLRLGAFAPEAPRDQALAENTLWVLSRIAPGERVVYWAHNAHVQKVPVQGPALPTGKFTASGSRFDAALGTRYYAIATTYGGPSMDDATPAPADSVDAALEAVGKGPMLLMLRKAPRKVDAWLSQERPMRFQVKTLNLALGKGFDAIAYFPAATKAARAE
jgi:erythromycin esterase